MPGSSRETAWLRLSWYASTYGSGSQLSTADSATTTYAAGELITVSTGAVLPPSNARSAKIRVMRGTIRETSPWASSGSVAGFYA